MFMNPMINKQRGEKINFDAARIEPMTERYAFFFSKVDY